MEQREILKRAEVPDDLVQQALDSIARAELATDGLNLHKLKTRLVMPAKISKALPWDAERLLDVRPEWAKYDVAPMKNISCNGDNGPWVHTPEGGRPVTHYWLNPDPESEEYKLAVSKCYWCPGHHPRSREAREAWYRRNGGEYLAYQRGVLADPSQPVVQYRMETKNLHAVVTCNNGAWIIAQRRKLAGKLLLTKRHGYEVDNVFCGPGLSQVWFPIQDYALKAPATSGGRVRWQNLKKN